MYRKILLVLALAIAANCVVASTIEKESLTAEQIAKGLPAGIIKSKASASYWGDKDNVVLVEGGKHSRYNIKSGESESFEPAKSKVNPSILTEMKKTYSNPTFSPDSSKVAYTKDGNLFVMDVATGVHTPLTSDGTNLILNGWSSWVYYEEILGRSTNYKAFWWSPDSKKLAYYKFDDSNVKMFPIYNSEGKYGTLTETRYPKAGEDNPTVEVAIIDLESGETTWGDFNKSDDQYFGIPFWSAESDKFMVPWMPREQNELMLYAVSPLDGSKEHIYKEQQATWIDWINQMVFTEEGFFMIRDFELWEQIYYQSFDGKVLTQLTTGRNWDTKIIKHDAKAGVIFFTSRADASTRNDVYKLTLKGKKVEKVSLGEYNYTNVLISPDNKHFVADISNVAEPTKLVLIDISKKPMMRVLSDSKGENFDKYELATPQMVEIEVDGLKLPGSITLPADLDVNKKYPVIINIYGGPNATTVMNRWSNPNSTNQLLAKEGVIQISIDNRASGHCGKEGLNFIHRSLGQYELHDFIEWVKYLRTLPYVDAEKIGITGFSFGGTMTALALTDGAEYFQYGIAGGGVYDWQLYDTHYTERYMDTPQDNKEGYDFTRVWNRADKYLGGGVNGSMLRLSHGTSDDNVHMQNTMQLIDALHKENKEFELMLYPGGYHGYGGYQGKHHTTENMRFWYKYLLGRELPEYYK
ncbi:MAG: DPP IV N-terminal domain-containing protein [Rikenellaceae bacterium]